MRLSLLIATIGTAAPAVLSLEVARSPETYTLTSSSVDGGGETSTGGGYRLRGAIGQPDAAASSNDGYTLKGGFWTTASVAAACTANAGCDDADVCTYDECVSNVCANTDRLYGDVNGNGVPNVFDIFCQLDVVAGADPLPEGCDPVNADIEPCTPNGTVNVFDMFAVLAAIAGDNACSCPAGPP